jgi:hypothetical protein
LKLWTLWTPQAALLAVATVPDPTPPAGASPQAAGAAGSVLLDAKTPPTTLFWASRQYMYRSKFQEALLLLRLPAVCALRPASGMAPGSRLGVSVWLGCCCCCCSCPHPPSSPAVLLRGPQHQHQGSCRQHTHAWTCLSHITLHDPGSAAAAFQDLSIGTSVHHTHSTMCTTALLARKQAWLAKPWVHPDSQPAYALTQAQAGLQLVQHLLWPVQPSTPLGFPTCRDTTRGPCWS